MAEVLFRAKLCREGAQTPWGFRLQGGVEYSTPLTLLKVAEKSIAAKCGLKAGDNVVKIAGKSAENLSHKEAQQVIIGSGNNLEIIVERADATVVIPKETPQPQPDQLLEQGSVANSSGQVVDEHSPNAIHYPIVTDPSSEVGRENADIARNNADVARINADVARINATYASDSVQFQETPVESRKINGQNGTNTTSLQQQQVSESSRVQSSQIHPAANGWSPGETTSQISPENSSNVKVTIVDQNKNQRKKQIFALRTSTSSDSDDSVIEKNPAVVPSKDLQHSQSNSDSSSGSLESVSSGSDHSGPKDSKYPWRRARKNGRYEQPQTRSISEPARSLLAGENNVKVVVPQKSVSVSNLSHDMKFKPIKAGLKPSQLEAVTEESKDDKGNNVLFGAKSITSSVFSPVKRAQEVLVRQLSDSPTMKRETVIIDTSSRNSPDKKDLMFFTPITTDEPSSRHDQEPVLAQDSSNANFETPSSQENPYISVADPDLIGISMPTVKDIVSSFNKHLETSTDSFVAVTRDFGVTYSTKPASVPPSLATIKDETPSTGGSATETDLLRQKIRSPILHRPDSNSPSCPMSPGQRRVRFAEEANVIEIEPGLRRVPYKERRREDKYPEYYQKLKEQQNAQQQGALTLPTGSEQSVLTSTAGFYDKINQTQLGNKMTFPTTMQTTQDAMFGDGVKYATLPKAQTTRLNNNLHSSLPPRFPAPQPQISTKNIRVSPTNVSRLAEPTNNSMLRPTGHLPNQVIGKLSPSPPVTRQQLVSPVSFRTTFSGSPSPMGSMGSPVRQLQSAYDMYKGFPRRNSTGGVTLSTSRLSPGHGFTFSIGGSPSTGDHSINVSFRHQVGAEAPTEYSFQIPSSHTDYGMQYPQHITYSLTPDGALIQRRDKRLMSFSHGTPPRELMNYPSLQSQQQMLPSRSRMIQVSYPQATLTQAPQSYTQPKPLAFQRVQTQTLNTQQAPRLYQYRSSTPPLRPTTPPSQQPQGTPSSQLYNNLKPLPYKPPPPYYPSTSPPPWNPNQQEGMSDLPQSKVFKQLETHLSQGVPQPPTSARTYIPPPAASPLTRPLTSVASPLNRPLTPGAVRTQLQLPRFATDEIHSGPAYARAFKTSQGSYITAEKDTGYQLSATYQLVHEMDKEQKTEDKYQLPYVDL